MINNTLTVSVSGLVADWTLVIESSTDLRYWTPIQTNRTSGTSQNITYPIRTASGVEFLRATVK